MKNRFIMWKKSDKFCFDLIAFALGVGLFVYSLYSAKVGIGLPDEHWYYTLAQRLSHGDQFLVHIWEVQQPTLLADLIPYWLFYRINNGTEGLILFTRYCFVFANTGFFVYMYVKLRDYKIWGIISAFLFCAFIPFSTWALQYYSVSTMAFMTVCLELLTGKQEKNRKKLFFIGMIFMFGIITEPIVLFGYVFYCLLCLVWKISKRDKNGSSQYGFILGGRSFGFISLGVLSMLLLFFGVLAVNGSLFKLDQSLPYLFTVNNYSGNDLFDLNKIPMAMRYYGTVPLIGVVVCLIFSFFIRGKDTKRSTKMLIFAVSCVCIIACYLIGFITWVSQKEDVDYRFVVYHGLPMLLFSLVCWLLSEERDRRLFAFWVIGFIYSICVDFASDVVIGMGGKLTVVVGILYFGSLWSGMKNHDQKRKKTVFEGNGKKLRRGVLATASVALAFVLCWDVVYLLSLTFCPPVEGSIQKCELRELNAEIESGPCKGLLTTQNNKKIYDDLLDDMEIILQDLQDEQPVLVFGCCPIAYLYLDTVCASNSIYFETDDRLRDYYREFPEKLPDYVYYPFYNYFSFLQFEGIDLQTDHIRAVLDDAFAEYDITYTVEKGKCGYICRVTKE